MSLRALFPTFVYSASLQRAGTLAFNRQVLKEAKQLRKDDDAGRRWSAANYPGGYTSYGSAHRLQTVSPTFERLERRLKRHVRAFSQGLDWDLGGHQLVMTDCWLNIMGQHAGHSLHLHPLSVISGTYYVHVPGRGPGIKFEDPRLERFMAAPPRSASAHPDNQTWITLPAVAGKVVLFESWLRHEVTPNPQTAERVSVSFNYNWY